MEIAVEKNYKVKMTEEEMITLCNLIGSIQKLIERKDPDIEALSKYTDFKPLFELKKCMYAVYPTTPF